MRIRFKVASNILFLAKVVYRTYAISGLCPEFYLENLQRSSITCIWNPCVFRFQFGSPILKYILPFLTKRLIDKTLLGRKFTHNLVKIHVKDQQQEKFTMCDLLSVTRSFQGAETSTRCFRTTIRVSFFSKRGNTFLLQLRKT